MTTRRTKTANITKDGVTSASHRQKVTVINSHHTGSWLSVGYDTMLIIDYLVGEQRPAAVRCAEFLFVIAALCEVVNRILQDCIAAVDCSRLQYPFGCYPLGNDVQVRCLKPRTRPRT